MSVGSLPGPRVATLRGLVFAIVVIGGLAFPAGLGGYRAQYLWIAAGGALLLFTLPLRLRTEALLLGGAFTALGFVSAILAPDVWQVREYVRVVLFVYLLLVIDEPTRRMVLRAVVVAAVAFLTFDFVALYLLDLEVLKRVLYQRGMQSYVDHYWRHVGFLGNPNSSGAFYAIIIVSATAAGLSNFVRSLTGKALAAYCLALSVILLGLTLSRTAMIATAGAVLVMIAFRINRRRQLIAGFTFLSLVATVWLTNAWGVQERFSSSSSLLARISLWQSLFGSVTAGSLVAGGWGEAPVVDNDLIYFVHNFGLVGAVTNYLVVLILLMRLWAAKLRTVMAGFLVLFVLLGIGMGFFADPRFALLVFAGSVLIPRPASRTPRLPRPASSRLATAPQVASPPHASAATFW